MLKRLVGILALSGLLFGGAYADDILAIVSKGQLTSNSAGVKELSLEEKMQVKGGAFQSVGSCFTNSNYCLSLAVSQTITGTHYRDFKAVLPYEEPSTTSMHIGYMVQKNWSYSNLGQKFSYFTYIPLVLDRNTGNMYRQSSLVLNYNGIVKELSYRHKSNFDRQLGGLSR